MIGFLRGTILDQRQSPILIDVRDVGYEVYVSLRTLSQFEVGNDVAIYTQQVVRENSVELFGFLGLDEKTLFGLLCKVPKIGARTAMNVLGVLTPAEVMHAIQTGDALALTRVPGIGKKTAERVLVELRDLAVDFGTAVAADASGGLREAVDALISLGFAQSVAEAGAIAVLDQSPSATTDQIIRAVLQGGG